MPDTRGPFLERPGKLSGPVSHPVSPRKLFGCFSKLPLFSIPLIFPVNCPVIYGRSWPPVKLPGSRRGRKTKQNGDRRRTFFVFREDHSHIKDAPFLSIWLTARSLNDFNSLEKEWSSSSRKMKEEYWKETRRDSPLASIGNAGNINSSCFIFL